MTNYDLKDPEVVAALSKRLEGTPLAVGGPLVIKQAPLSKKDISMLKRKEEANG